MVSKETYKQNIEESLGKKKALYTLEEQQYAKRTPKTNIPQMEDFLKEIICKHVKYKIRREN